MDPLLNGSKNQNLKSFGSISQAFVAKMAWKYSKTTDQQRPRGTCLFTGGFGRHFAEASSRKDSRSRSSCMPSFGSPARGSYRG